MLFTGDESWQWIPRFTGNPGWRVMQVKLTLQGPGSTTRGFGRISCEVIFRNTLYNKCALEKKNDVNHIFKKMHTLRSDF
jgi:hypothetical protein